jgi:hypothetical protein
MKLTDRTILITGGSAGIGLAFALKFLELGNQVIVTGRREAVLDELKAESSTQPSTGAVIFDPVNRNVGGSNPPRGAKIFVLNKLQSLCRAFGCEPDGCCSIRLIFQWFTRSCHESVTGFPSFGRGFDSHRPLHKSR